MGDWANYCWSQYELLYLYLLRKSYQGTRKIMQKSTKKEKKNIQKKIKIQKNLTRCKYSSQSFVHLT